MKLWTLTTRAEIAPRGSKLVPIVENRYWRSLREVWDPADACAGIALLGLLIGYGWCCYKLVKWLALTVLELA